MFNVTSSTIAFRHCSFSGENIADTILNLEESKSTYGFNSFVTISFEDCFFSSALFGIRSDSPISIDSCRFEQIKDTCIHLDVPSTVDPLSEFSVSNTSINGGSLGLYFQSSLHHLMLTKLSVLHSDIGLRLLGPFTLYHCEIMHCSAIGVYSKEKTEGKFGVISDCLISHCPSAVTVFYCDLAVRNSRVFRCEYGVQAFSCFALNVHDCIIHDCGQKGVFANYVNLVKIKKNAIYDCACGIVVDSSIILQIENNWLLYISNCFLEISNVVVGVVEDLHCRALPS